MIHNEEEYNQAVERLKAEADRLAQQERQLRDMGLDDDQIKRALDPMRSFHAQLREEVDSYERLRRGEIVELESLGGLGQLLVMLRIARKMSQKELARKLDVDPSQVSRDERNEYRGITLERTMRVLDALGATVRTKVELDGPDSRTAA